MRTVANSDETNTTGALVIVAATMVASVASWPWPMISAFVALVALGVIVHVNVARPRVRRHRLKAPVDAWFVIPPQKDHGCDFAAQDDQEHLVKTVVIPRDSEIIIDLRFDPRLFFSYSEIRTGCDADGAPKAREYFNRFVVEGEGKHVVPGPGNRHYIDKHGGYHYRELAASRQWSRGTAYSMAFKFKTFSPGKYKVDVHFLGDEVEGKNSELTIVVEDHPQTVMRCAIRKHRKLPCAATGIRPL